MGENAITFPRDGQVIQHRKVWSSQEMASKKNHHRLGNLAIRLHRLLAEKEIGRNLKRCESSTCHHQSLNQLWTIGFSIRLGANWGKVWAHFGMNRFLPCCLGQSTVACESGVLPMRRPSSSSSINQLSDLEPLKLHTFLFFLGETIHNKINIMELKTPRLLRAHCPQLERKRYQGKERKWMFAEFPPSTPEVCWSACVLWAFNPQNTMRCIVLPASCR